VKVQKEAFALPSKEKRIAEFGTRVQRNYKVA
jgi:hypothetical protein